MSDVWEDKQEEEGIGRIGFCFAFSQALEVCFYCIALGGRAMQSHFGSS
jgi:hypothetical protein